MNRLIPGLGLFLLVVPAWAQQPPTGNGSNCISVSAIQDCTGLDDRTLEIDAGRKDYLMSVESCSALPGRHCRGSVGNPGIAFETFARPRVCVGHRIILRDAVTNQLQFCLIQDIVRFQINPLTNEVEINEFDH